MNRMEMYKHVRNTDVAILVLNTIPLKDSVKVKVRWMNVVNPMNIFQCDPKPDTIEIKNADLANWRKYD